MTMMRMAKTPQSVNGYTIPPGHQVCVSPTVNQRLQEVWRDAAEFNPDRSVCVCVCVCACMHACELLCVVCVRMFLRENTELVDTYALN